MRCSAMLLLPHQSINPSVYKANVLGKQGRMEEATYKRALEADPMPCLIDENGEAENASEADEWAPLVPPPLNPLRDACIWRLQ